MDIDGNGTMDILSGSWPGELYLFKRKPNGIYSAPEKLRDASGRMIKVGSASAVAVADWDQDGDLDLVVGNIDGALFLLRNQGTSKKASFAPAENLKARGAPVTASGGDAGPCLADWDGDGKIDLLIGTGSGSVVWHRNIGQKETELEAPVTLIEAVDQGRLRAEFDAPQRCGTRTKVAVADWNDDTKPDLLVGDFYSGVERKYHGWVWVYLRKNATVAAVVKNEE